jgi:dimethylamine/trimethylamine dehydrogenase
MVTSRIPHDTLYHDLRARQAEWEASGITSVKLIGDAAAPGPIAWATYAGRRFAEKLDEPDDRGDTPAFRREVAALEPLPSRLPPLGVLA